jgi:transcriptional regulator GlxA family with amidase domain
MLDRLKKVKIDPHPVDQIGQCLLDNPIPFSLDWLAGQACLSPRQFERKFNERIGVGPKLYSRISRFFLAFRHKANHPGLDWLTVATHFGYTDYYHLAKDFKPFSGATPNLILDQHARRPEAKVVRYTH